MEILAAERQVRFIVGHAIGDAAKVKEYLADFRARRVDALVSFHHNHPGYEGAVLEVDGVARDLSAGDWWLLPAGTPHRLVSAEPGTSWLAVRSTR